MRLTAAILFGSGAAGFIWTAAVAAAELPSAILAQTDGRPSEGLTLSDLAGGGAIAALVTVVGYFVWHLDRVHQRHEKASEARDASHAAALKQRDDQFVAALKARDDQHVAQLREVISEEREFHRRAIASIDRSNRMAAIVLQRAEEDEAGSGIHQHHPNDPKRKHPETGA